MVLGNVFSPCGGGKRRKEVAGGSTPVSMGEKTLDDRRQTNAGRKMGSGGDRKTGGGGREKRAGARVRQNSGGGEAGGWPRVGRCNLKKKTWRGA